MLNSVVLQRKFHIGRVIQSLDPLLLKAPELPFLSITFQVQSPCVLFYLVR